MKTILWAALSANGNYATNSPEHPPKPEALADFAAHVREAGNFVVGRKTFESFGAAGGESPFEGIDIVVVSSDPTPIPGVTKASSPKDALTYLAAKGHQTAVIAGGERLHNSFLASGLVDEVVFNVTPIFGSQGMKVALPEGPQREAELLSHKALGGGIVQLRYGLTSA